MTSLKTRFYIVNMTCSKQLIGGPGYDSMNEAKLAIPSCNIPDDKAEVTSIDFKFLRSHVPVIR